LQFSLQAASPETFGYTLVFICQLSNQHKLSKEPIVKQGDIRIMKTAELKFMRCTAGCIEEMNIFQKNLKQTQSKGNVQSAHTNG
jgi:hypothetical protein